MTRCYKAFLSGICVGASQRRRALLLSAAILVLAAGSRAEDISVSLAGKDRDAVSSYKVGSSYFLNAKQAGSLYGGQVYWYAVSGRVQMSFRGRVLQFLVDSDVARLEGKPVKMDSAVLLRTSQAYVPLSFFLSDEFAEFSGMSSSFDAKTKFLTVEPLSSVGPLRWFSYPDATRLSVELKPGISYSASARGVGGLEVAFPLGAIAAAEDASVDDGLVDSAALRQGPQSVKLAVKFAEKGLHWRAKELSSPRRLVVDVYRGAAPSIPASDSASAAKAGAEQTAPQAVRRKIVVDAGHGGKDPGATGRGGTHEKDINLLAAQQLAKLLKEEGTFDVVMTRDDDTFVPLADRSRIANEAGADLFISLHCNASTNKRENGFEVYFLSEKASDPEAQRLADVENSVVELEGKNPQDLQAELILGELSKTENINAGSEWAALEARAVAKRVELEARGVKQAGFYVLRGTHAPAVLFEMAFVTNKQDEAKLESRRFRRKIVDGIYAGILDYAKREGWVGRLAQKK